MQALTIQVNPQSQPAVFTPKLNYGFYLQTRDDKALSQSGQDGFSALVNGLLDEDVDMIVAAYYHSFAWLGRSQPSMTAVEAALENVMFNDEKATEAAFDDILKSLQTNDFLARKLNQFIKSNDKLTATMKKHIESMTDEDRKDQMEIGMLQINDSTTKLQQLMTPQESSPKQDESDSHLLS
ncbi:hypothetical protein DKZ23_10020 [Limosilactobacillus reuteri]|uniref:Uncharacterized protein n=1 Tax=Limosilactobacillus reuteri TaxID=1598 RepID=A0A317GGF6_LIMRT|nr:tail assembly chaperone [Limosilactobacillus reuteri]MCH5384942.1 hypothetical protein [Limosilactobacillus reuteri]PWT45128.1 hypothetical protein DKZ23_10020 [Limosilactobacillus reuteri]PWT47291.1 hypothetical protein DKZ33_10055 [Limosilactobacillus reuteri]PWT58741.1 hypothetical protein DKZ32_09975 [Limosilactobacillus reuteri]